MFLVQLEFARHYPMAYSLSAGGGRPPNNPVLERLLPSLLHIKMMALLDEALEEYLTGKGQKLPSKYRDDLNGRISYFSDAGLVSNAPDLHVARKRRNGAAHELLSDVSWAEFDSDVDQVQAALDLLGLVPARPSFKVTAERSQMRESDDPTVFREQDFAVIVWQGEKKAGEFTWTERILDHERGAHGSR